jgi:hypothetical protein
MIVGFVVIERECLPSVVVVASTDHLPLTVLGSGTVLGWYRECGVIAHTTDMDFMIAVGSIVNDEHYSLLLVCFVAALFSVDFGVLLLSCRSRKFISQNTGKSPRTRNIGPSDSVWQSDARWRRNAVLVLPSSVC